MSLAIQRKTKLLKVVFNKENYDTFYQITEEISSINLRVLLLISISFFGNLRVYKMGSYNKVLFILLLLILLFTTDQGNLQLTYQTLPFFNSIKPKEHSLIINSTYDSGDKVFLKSLLKIVWLKKNSLIKNRHFFLYKM